MSTSATEHTRAALPRRTRPLYWSVRRELWENRSLYLGPLAAATVILLGFAVGSLRLPRRLRALEALEPARQAEALMVPYSLAAVLLILTAFLVGAFYCLDALHSERRDRSILFWKSLPVSDRTTVAAKAAVPLVVLPAFSFALIVATQLVMLLLSASVALAHGLDPGLLFRRLPLAQSSLVLLYGLSITTLWHAPLYAWLLLASSWARRATLAWAVLPWLAICAAEALALRSTHCARFVRQRLTGGFARAFDVPEGASGVLIGLAQLAPGKFLASPGLWLGLGAAALFLGAAVRLRRQRLPI